MTCSGVLRNRQELSCCKWRFRSCAEFSARLRECQFFREVVRLSSRVSSKQAESPPSLEEQLAINRALQTSRSHQFSPSSLINSSPSTNFKSQTSTMAYNDIFCFLDSVQAQELLQQQATMEDRGEDSQKRTGPSRVRNRPSKRLHD